MLSFPVLGGLGGALLNSPAIGAIAHHFHKLRGLAVGLATTAGSIGGIIFPLLYRSLVPKIGFAWTSRILGFIFAGRAIPQILFIRGRLPPGGKRVAIWPQWNLFRDGKFTMLFLSIFFIEYGVLVPMTYIVSYSSAFGRDPVDSYQFVAIFNAGSAAGRFLPGLVSDRVGRFNVLSLSLSLCTIFVFTLWLPANGSTNLVYAFAILHGFASGGNVSLVPVCVGQLCETHEYGQYLSMAMLSASFGTLTSIPAGGSLLKDSDALNSWQHLIMFSGFSYVASLICCVMARGLAVGWKISTRF